ncbi:hypothetical protein [Lactiplantibacillus fabifermentans]|uniref:Uncharacterized protein n=2 Tax=Lactiplantibacillus fabifermentans TaxID=483011 RepID=A0A0R2NX48_9LACO|nr:hypothetical protein [Lactiplantibacillus fabifermentans]ETY74770.1 hypothetical protein LFAB_05345 [Lactiplantibacillus fabifermentans T30PCM01]KRO29218.1 hypothetical protein DY78_GL001269 [Lactiplantibacillus fabifermentans DSM 21115]
MDAITKFLQQYTFEPVTTKAKFDQHELTVNHDSREIPLGHFKLRLKNVDNQQDYPLTLTQQLQLTTPKTGLHLAQRLRGMHVHHADDITRNQLRVIVTLRPKGQSKAQATCPVPVIKQTASALPTSLPVYAFDDSEKIAINQTALARLFLHSPAGQEFTKVG